jgi:hypothetical protein
VYEYDPKSDSWIARGESFIGNSTDRLGHRVALSTDGRTLGVAASNYDGGISYAEVLSWNATAAVWHLFGRVDGLSSAPSLSIALSDSLYDYQGPRIVLGDPSDGIGGKAEVYECTMNNGCSLLDVQLRGYDYEDLFGSDVSISTNGNVIAIASPGLIECGEVCANVKVYAYGRGTEAVWSLVGQELMGAIGFGVNIKLSGDGNILAIVYDIYESTLVSRTQVYALETGVWTTVGPPIEASLLDMSRDGTVVATSENGKVALKTLVSMR